MKQSGLSIVEGCGQSPHEERQLPCRCLFWLLHLFVRLTGSDGSPVPTKRRVGQRATLVCHPECRIQHQPGKESNCVACWAADAGLDDTRQQGASLGELR